MNSDNTRRETTARLRGDARVTPREALVALGTALRFPLEIDDEGAEYLLPTSDTTLEVHVDDSDSRYPLVLTLWHWRSQTEARLILDELRSRITRTTGWTIVASE